MRRPIWPFLISLGVVVLATGGGLLATRSAAERATETGREERARLEDARATHDAALRKRAAASEVAATAQIAAWQREADALARELEELRRAAAAVSSSVPAVNPSSLAAAPRPTNPWENAGRAAPLATFQTVQWAINEGDVDVLVEAIALDPAAQEAAQHFFDSLDPESKREFGSSARLIASAMAAKSRSDLSSAEIVGESMSSAGSQEVRVRIAGTHSRPREITLRFQPSADGWKLEVPAKIVTSYRNLLLGPVIDPKTYQVVR